jgi:hypothetical protein
MKCPHCITEIHDKQNALLVGHDKDGGWFVTIVSCPACKRLILKLVNGTGTVPFINGMKVVDVQTEYLIRPKAPSRTPPPPEVPPKFVEDYREACLVISDSPKASAALSRRCLQHLLRDVAKVKPGNLSAEIQEVIDSKTLPSYIAESIDAVRNIGNFAAHPAKDNSTGEIIDVEPGEAEWNLDVLESLFDFYFVQPALLKKKRDALDAKLKGAGKPPMK